MATRRNRLRKRDSQCNFCHEIMPKPKLLECLHNFCTRCIQQLQKISDPGNKIKCPVCNKYSEVIFKAKEMVEMSEPKSTPVVPQSASVIDETTATHSTRITHHDLRNIDIFLNNQVNCIDRQHQCGRLMNYKSSLWAACQHDSCIDVYRHDLAFIKTIPCPLITKSRTIHPLTSQLMIVGGNNGLFVVDTDSGQMKETILSGFIYDVHVDQGLIAVAVYVDGTRYVQVLQQSPPYNTVFRVEHSLALTVLITSDEKILASDWDKHVITEYSKHGDKITEYGKHGNSGTPGDLDDPYLCLTDTRGNVLVADYRNHRLQVLTKDGDWIMQQQDREYFYFPRDITATDTHLYVNDFNNIYMFAIHTDCK